MPFEGSPPEVTGSGARRFRVMLITFNITACTSGVSRYGGEYIVWQCLSQRSLPNGLFRPYSGLKNQRGVGGTTSTCRGLDLLEWFLGAVLMNLEGPVRHRVSGCRGRGTSLRRLMVLGEGSLLVVTGVDGCCSMLPQSSGSPSVLEALHGGGLRRYHQPRSRSPRFSRVS